MQKKNLKNIFNKKQISINPATLGVSANRASMRRVVHSSRSTKRDVENVSTGYCYFKLNLDYWAINGLNIFLVLRFSNSNCFVGVNAIKTGGHFRVAYYSVVCLQWYMFKYV